MNGYFVVGVVLLLASLGVGCGASFLDTAIRAANVASVAAAAAPEEIKIVCEAAVERSKTPEDADKVIATCGKAEDAYNAFRLAWLAAADAIRIAQLKHTDPPAEIIDALTRAEEDLFAIIDLIRGM